MPESATEPGGLARDVPGKLLLKLTKRGEALVTEPIPPGPARRATNPLPTHFGNESVDKLLDPLKPRGIVAVHGRFSNATMGRGDTDTAPMHTTTSDLGKTVPLPRNRSIGEISAEMGGTYEVTHGASMPADTIKALKASEHVADAAPNSYRRIYQVAGSMTESQRWGLLKIRCPEAWEWLKERAAVTVAVVDTGVDLDHPDLRDHVLPGYDAVDSGPPLPVSGWRFDGDCLTTEANPDDEVGHGTHVAGTIVAITSTPRQAGASTSSCKIMPVKSLARVLHYSDGSVSGVGTAADVARGVRWAVDHGAHIINLSLGGYYDTFAEADAIAYALARGCLVVAAIGDTSPAGRSEQLYPAAYPGVLAVGAIDQSDARWSMSSYSEHLALVAPGVDIWSAFWDNTYGESTGTSMAAAHVSGVAALVMSCAPSRSARDVARILRETARALPAWNEGVPNNRFGYGLVDARAAVERACPHSPSEHNI